MKILAIDFGLKHFGLAINEAGLAEPLIQLEIKTSQKTFSRLKQICLKNKINLIVLGLPQGKLASIIKKFGQNLKKELGLPVVFQDETLTSKEAKQKMIEANKPLKKRRNDHLFAACLILQSYLDENMIK